MISRNLPESRKKDKNNKVSIDGLKKSRAGEQQRFFIKKKLCFWRERVRRTFPGESALMQRSQHNKIPQNFGAVQDVAQPAAELADQYFAQPESSP